MAKMTFKKPEAGTQQSEVPSANPEGAEPTGELVPTRREVSTPAVERNVKVGGIAGDFTSKDFVIPRLNIVQAVGKLSEDWKAGSIVYNNEIELIPPSKDAKEWTAPLSLTVLTAKQDFIQNVEYDSDDKADVVDTLDEVERRGGTVEYAGDTPPSWVPRLNMLVLVEAPEGNEKLAERFSMSTPDGKPCELAMWTVKKSSYTRAGKTVITASKYSLKNKETGESELHHGKWTLQVRREKLGEYFVFVPLLKQCGRHDKAFVEFAESLI